MRDGEAVFVLKQIMSLWVIPFASILACGLFWMVVGAVRSKRKKRQQREDIHKSAGAAKKIWAYDTTDLRCVLLQTRRRMRGKGKREQREESGSVPV